MSITEKNLNTAKKSKRIAKPEVKNTVSVGILCGVVALVMIIRGIGVQPDINANKEVIAELEAKIQAEKEYQAEVDRLKENADSDAYIEKIARDRLGMVKSDEILFIDVAEK